MFYYYSALTNVLAQSFLPASIETLDEYSKNLVNMSLGDFHTMEQQLYTLDQNIL